MSKTNQKVELVEEKAANKGFSENPKLFSKWTYDNIEVQPYLFRLKILASLTTSQPSQLKLKSLSPIPQQDIRLKDSVRLFAQLLRGWLDPSNLWEETLVRK